MKCRGRGWMQPTVRRQMIAGVALVHAVLILTMIPDFVIRQRTFLQDRAQERAFAQAELLAASSVPQLLTNDMAGLSDVLASISRDSTIRFAMITDTAGKILAHTDKRRIRKYLSDPTSLHQLQSAPKRAIVYQNADLVETAAPVALENSVLGWSWVAADRTGDNAQIAVLIRSSIIYAAIALACGILVAIWFGTVLTRSLRLLTAGAARMAAGILDIPVPVTTRTEAGTLANAFNAAMSQLAAHGRQVQRTQAALEAEVAERRRAEHQLQAANASILAANESLRQFAYAASHDLQEPLRAVVSFSKILRNRYREKLDGGDGELLDLVHDSAERTQQLIHGLLEYSRAGGDHAQAPQVVDAGAALEAALSNLQAAIQDSFAEVENGRLPALRVHEVALVQLFQNLIGNAIKYSADKPRIRITTERNGLYWRFAIADNGIGIEPRDQRRVFRIFTRAHGQDYPGTGVGLAICSKIVERYGGKIWVESEVGSGSTFYFTLPAADPARIPN